VFIPAGIVLAIPAGGLAVGKDIAELFPENFDPKKVAKTP